MSGELHQLLGDGASAAVAVEGRDMPTVEESTTVLKCDRWTRRAGARLAGQWAEAGVEKIVAEDWPLAADALETLISTSPQPAERPQDQQRARWWKQLMDTPDCTALRARTVASPMLAEIAAAEVARQWVAYVAENPEQENGEQGEESAQQSVNRIRSTREALSQAVQAADDAEACGAGLGIGDGGTLEGAKLAQYTRRLRRSPNLAKIMRMAGRFIAKAKMLQRQRTNLPGPEITGVELSGDIARLLPIESSLIAGAVPELEVLAMARLAQRRSLSYRRILRTPVAMGPIVVSVDESGSMGGENIEAAKGLALAMASIARAQKRPFLLCAWADQPAGGIRIASGGADAIVEWLEGFFSGGTDLTGPLATLPSTSWPAGPIGARSDHIIITDGEVPLDDEMRENYLAWAKATGVRTFGIGIGAKTEVLSRVCDGGVWSLPNLDLNNPAVDVVLSIGPTEMRAA